MSKQVEAIFEAIENARKEGKHPRELRMQASTLWRLEPDLPAMLYVNIVTDETVKKNVVRIEWSD